MRPNDMVARLLNMGIFTPETAAQFYQSRYPGLTAEQVQEAYGAVRVCSRRGGSGRLAYDV
jgi:hypothetical protein